jgi:TetR/AcrR family transcriptional regulator
MARHPLREELRQLRERLRAQAREHREEIRQQQRELREQRHAYGRMGSRGQPEESRAAILRAAVEEFAEHGIAGARTDAIAREARVNKALLYYYFKDKETLYGAVLDDAFSALKAAVMGVLQSDLPPREKILAYVGAYFDFVATHKTYPRLMQREMMRAKEGASPHIERITKNYFEPIFVGVRQLIEKGIAEGEFRAVDPVHFIPSMISIIVFYFSGSPMMRKLFGFNPFAPERIAERRIAVLDFISHALFSGQEQFRDTQRQSTRHQAGHHQANQGARS